MPKPTLTTDPTLAQVSNLLTDLDLSPRTVAEIEARLSTYAALKADVDLLTQQLDDERLLIGAALDTHGITSARSATGTAMYWVKGATTRKLDLTKLLAQGVTTAQVEAATVEKPKKPSFTIRLKGEKQEEKE